MLNLVLVFVGIDVLGFDSSLEQNYVNVVTMEISLVYSFLVYKVFVWRDGTPYWSRGFLQQLSLYHLSAGSGVLARVLLFPLLQMAGVHYLLNVALGIAVGSAINYVLSDRYVFTNPGKGSPGRRKSA